MVLLIYFYLKRLSFWKIFGSIFIVRLLPKRMTLILVFGPSTTWGAWDEEGGWADRLKKYFSQRKLADPEKQGILVYNQRVSGDSSQDILDRFEHETEQRLRDLDKGEEVIFIITVGINDAQFIKSEDRFRVPLEAYQKNVEELIRLAKKHSQKIVFVASKPIDDAKVDPIPWAPHLSYRNEYGKLYNDTIREICEKNSLPFIDLFEEWLKLDYKKLLFDGCHPNTEGHKLIFERVKSFLVEKKWV